MFLAEDQLKWLLYGFKSVKIGGFILLELDESGKMATQENIKKIKRGQRFATIMGLIAILTCLETYYETSEGLLSTPDLLLCIFLTSMYVSFYYSQRCIIKRRKQMAQLFNHAIKFEQQQNRKWHFNKYSNDRNKLYCMLGKNDEFFQQQTGDQTVSVDF